MKIWLSLFITLSILPLFSQTTVGVLSSTDEVFEGYTFFSPFSGTKAWLVDNCGNLINDWDRGTRPGLAAYFLESGHLFRTYKVDPEGPFTSASNAGGIELVDWNNNVIWKYEINTSEQLSHHDAVMMPNGNVLMLTWELTYRDELIELGRNPDEIASQNFMWSEKIVELEPVGSDDANIVWEWHINDHYIQDFDDTKEGFGFVADHPELFDINLPELNSSNSNASRDWNHFNAIDYNETLDQILISVRNSDEVWIIDHSTTTEEAASHEGGIYGKGGDILYRWGNASAYQGAPPEGQLLWGQHGVHWIQEGLDDELQILIYNNGNGKPGADFSQVQLLNPPQDSPGFYTRVEGVPYGPAALETIYGDQGGENFYSAFLSNAQRLPNGNTLINAGSPGLIFEVTPDRDVAWEYEIPLFGDFPATQGQNISDNANFRAYKYGPDYPGFDGLDLTPGLPIENNPNDCELVSSTKQEQNIEVYLQYNSSNNRIEVLANVHDVEQVFLYDLQGKLLHQFIPGISNASVEFEPNFGLYLGTIILKNGERQTLKFLAN